MKDTLQFIVASIVQNPLEVKISEEDVNGIATYTISVSKDDMGKVIGKGGKVIRSIRNVLKIKAIKENIRINIQLAEQPQE